MSKFTVVVAGNEDAKQQSVLDYLAEHLDPFVRDKLKLGVNITKIQVAEMDEKELESAKRQMTWTEDGPRFGTAKVFCDDAHRTADAILENIRDRSGIGNELEAFMHDDEVIDDLVNSVSALVRVGMKLA